MENEFGLGFGKGRREGFREGFKERKTTKKINFRIFDSVQNSVSSEISEISENLKNSENSEKMENGEQIKEALESVRSRYLSSLESDASLSLSLQNQIESELVLEGEWRERILRGGGKLRGSPWDPLEGEEVEFSRFWEMAQKGEVKYMEYAESGKNVAVILPYQADEMGLKVEVEAPPDRPELKSLNNVVYLRHPVTQMPADAQTEIWEQLRPQVININFRYPFSIWNQTYPTFALFIVWVFRLLVAVAVFRAVEKVCKPIYKPKKLSERPVLRRKKLGGGGMELGSMGQSRARFISAEESTGVSFSDFAGQDYVKRELQEVVKILKSDNTTSQGGQFGEMGVYCPKGVLLFGPPGTGKTLLARAIAGEAGVPFFSVSGAEFVEMFVGVAAARVRDLFARARQSSPSIIFIDEIDAIGAKRGAAEAGGGNIEREQGLVQILTELDGFQTNQAKVLVIGATNRLDMLDPALLRKGRFDKAIAVNRPTQEGRLAILKVHARNKPFESEEEKERLLKVVADVTYDYSGAELMNVLNEASILAVRKDKDFVDEEDLMESIQRQAGEFKTGEEDEIDISGEARLRVAYRESAVSILNCYFPDPKRPIVKTNSVDLEPFPNVEYLVPRNRIFSRKRDMVNAIVKACAPSVVEEMVFGGPNMAWNTGASIGEAGQLAEYLILQTGLTAFGPTHYETEQDLVPNLRPKLISLRDEYMRYAIQKCRSVLEEYRSALETLVEKLMEKELIFGDEILEAFQSAPRIPQPAVREVDEIFALMFSGRWGVHGITLPGRATFSPGNSGFVTFGAARPRLVQLISDETWEAMDRKKEEVTEEWEEEEEEEEIRETKHGNLFELSHMI